MKLNMIITIALSCVLVAGCQEVTDEGPNKSLVNRELIKTYNDMAIENAIIAQHTIYPYHFVPNSVELNDLGERDLTVLTRHFLKNGGHLNIRKNDISDELYESRVESVHAILREAGLDMDRIKISDDMPGGSGMASESILVILEQEDEIDVSTSSTSSGSMSIR